MYVYCLLTFSLEELSRKCASGYVLWQARLSVVRRKAHQPASILFSSCLPYCLMSLTGGEGEFSCFQDLLDLAGSDAGGTSSYSLVLKRLGACIVSPPWRGSSLASSLTLTTMEESCPGFSHKRSLSGYQFKGESYSSRSSPISKVSSSFFGTTRGLW